MQAARKEKTANERRQVIVTIFCLQSLQIANSSARAQDYMVSFGLPKQGDPMRATDEMFFNSTMQNATTNASHDLDMIGALSAGKLSKHLKKTDFIPCR